MMKCFHESCVPGLTPVGDTRPEPCICGQGTLGLDNAGTSSVLESIIEMSMRRGLLEELEAMGLTLHWDEETQRWQTMGCDEHPWETGSAELVRATQH